MKKSPAMKRIQTTPTMPLCQPAVSPDTAIHPETARARGGESLGGSEGVAVCGCDRLRLRVGVSRLLNVWRRLRRDYVVAEREVLAGLGIRSAGRRTATPSPEVSSGVPCLPHIAAVRFDHDLYVVVEPLACEVP